LILAETTQNSTKFSNQSTAKAKNSCTALTSVLSRSLCAYYVLHKKKRPHIKT